MSGTSNDFDHPGGNRPDRGDAAGVEPEAPESRSDAGVGGAVHEDAGDPQAQPGEETQDEPVLEQNTPTTQDKLDGIAAQTRVDLGDDSHDRYQDVLRQRLSDAGIQQTDDEVDSLARRAAPGGQQSGGGGV